MSKEGKCEKGYRVERQSFTKSSQKPSQKLYVTVEREKIERERERERQRGCKKKEIHPFFAWCIKASELTALHCLDLGFLHSPSKAL